MFVYSNHRSDALSTTRVASCSKCGNSIGTQVKWKSLGNFAIETPTDFHFVNEDREEFKFCPYCGEPLYKEPQ